MDHSAPLLALDHRYDAFSAASAAILWDGCAQCTRKDTDGRLADEAIGDCPLHQKKLGSDFREQNFPWAYAKIR